MRLIVSFLLLLCGATAQTTCGDQVLVPESKDPSGFYLSFPVDNRTVDSIQINSFFDHSMTTNYCANDEVVNYLGQRGDRTSDPNSAQFVVTLTCPATATKNDLYGFQSPFGFLFYDGHPGYDYRTTDQDPQSGEVIVRAAASGQINCVATPFIKDVPNKNTSCLEGKGSGVVEIDHGNGYRTAYLHMKCSNFQVGDFVTRGTPIGISDSIGAPNAPHLHFEVRKTVPSATNPIPIDPYGWHGGSLTLPDTGGLGVGDPYIYKDPRNPKSTEIDFERLAADLWHSGGVRWVFDIEGDSRGWYPKNVENLSIQNGRLNIDPQAVDPQLIGPPLMNVRAADFPSIEIALASGAPDGNAKIYFITETDQTFNEAKTVSCQISTDGQLHVYRFPMNQNANWTGLVRQIRFDPSVNGIGGTSSDTVSISYIALSPSTADASCNPGTSNNDFSLFVAPNISQAINPGGAATFRITTTSADGVARVISATLYGLPPNSSPSFSVPLITTQQTSDLSIKTSASTPVGDYTLTITAKQPDSGIIKTAAVTVTVRNAASSCSTFSNLTQPIWLTLGNGQIVAAGRGSIFVINTSSGTLNTVSFSAFPNSFSGRPIVLNGIAYVPLWNNPIQDQIAAVDLTNLTVQYFPTSPTPMAVATAGGNLLVAHAVIHNDGSPAPLDIINPNTGAILKTISAGVDTVAIAVAPEFRRAFASNNQSQDVSVIDLDSLTKIATIPIPILPSGIAYLRGKVYVVGIIPRTNDVGELISIDPSTLATSIPLSTGRGPADISLFHDSLVITNQSDYNIEFINLNTGQPSITLATSVVPTGVTVDPTSDKIYVANQDNSPGSISVFCPPQGAPLATSLQLDPVIAQSGALTVATMTLTNASPPGVAATVTSSALQNTANTSIVSTGGSAATFAVRANAVSATTSAAVVGTINGTSQQTLLTVNPASLPTASLSIAAITFSPIPVETTSTPQQITLTNNGTATLSIDGIRIQGEFLQSNNCSSQLDIRANCTITVTFQPTRGGNRTGILAITDSAADTPQLVTLAGTALPSTAHLSTTALDFGNSSVSTPSQPQHITLTNTSNVPLIIASIAMSSGNFQQQNTCPASLGPNASCDIAVIFTPLAVGSSSGTLTIDDNAIDTPQSVDLTGNGTDFQFQVASGSPTSITVQQGSTANFLLTVNALPSFAGTIAFSCAGVPAAATCGATPSQVTLGSGSTQASITLSISTPALTAGAMRQSFAWICACMLSLIILRKAKNQKLMLIVLSLLFLLSGCSGGGSHQNNGGNNLAGTYTLTVTATSGSDSHQQQLTLIIK